MQKMTIMEDKQRAEQDQLIAVKKDAEARQRDGGAGGTAPVSGEVMVRTRGGNIAVAISAIGPIEHKVIEGVNVDGLGRRRRSGRQGRQTSNR